MGRRQEGRLTSAWRPWVGDPQAGDVPQMVMVASQQCTRALSGGGEAENTSSKVSCSRQREEAAPTPGSSSLWLLPTN